MFEVKLHSVKGCVGCKHITKYYDGRTSAWPVSEKKVDEIVTILAQTTAHILNRAEDGKPGMEAYEVASELAHMYCYHINPKFDHCMSKLWDHITDSVVLVPDES